MKKVKLTKAVKSAILHVTSVAANASTLLTAEETLIFMDHLSQTFWETRELVAQAQAFGKTQVRIAAQVKRQEKGT